MKRGFYFGLWLLIGVVLAVPYGVVVSGQQVRLAPNVAVAIQDNGGGGGGSPSSPNNSLTGKGDPVCVAVPIFAGSPGPNCKKGQVEIPNDPGSGGAIVFYLKLILKLVNGLIGGIIILVLVVAGIQYITSAADPGRVKAAKNRIINAITALVLYMMMFAILNFLVPGGIL